MAQKLKKRSKKAGLPPGSVIYIGEKKYEKPRITLFCYTDETFEEYELSDVSECAPFLERSRSPSSLSGKRPITWVNVDGIQDVRTIETLGKMVGLHPLVLEDIVNTTQRPKRVDYDNYVHVTLRSLNFEPKRGTIDSEQLSFILGNHYLLSFQEIAGDAFDQVRERLRTGKGRLRKSFADYLFYALVDASVDSFFAILEEVGERVESLEAKVLSSDPSGLLEPIHHFKKQMLYLRRSVWPLREVVNSFSRDESDFIVESTQVYFRDVYDHTIEVIEIIEMLRDMSGSMVELYMSSINNRMNMVMKTLTVMSSIFMPLTFIVGVYGMNFEFMPELHWKLGYPLIMLFMLGLSAAMLAHFRRRKWL